MSERRACRLLELDRSSYRYEPRADHNADLREALVKLARQKPRYDTDDCMCCCASAGTRRVRSGFTGCTARNS